MTIRYETASAADLTAIGALLGEVGLPRADVDPALQHFIVARDGARIVGCVALEPYGDAALLRSLAVAPTHQGTGLGKALYAEVLAEAKRRHLAALYLLTTTAEGFFRRAGFARVDRAAVPGAVAQSEEFRSLCPATAVCMALRLAEA